MRNAQNEKSYLQIMKSPLTIIMVIKMNNDLKIAEDNFNFNYEILDRVFLEKLKIPFSQPAIFYVLSGAKGFGKTYLLCLLSLYMTCNYLDSNAILARYTYVSAKEAFSNTMSRVINDLAEYGVTVNTAIEEKIIKAYNNDNRTEWVFENGRVIKIVGFDNTKWEGVPAKIGEWSFFGLDEVIPLDKSIPDDIEYLYRLINILQQVFRGIKYTAEEPRDDRWIYKHKMVIFGFNNHSTLHVIYQLMVFSIAPTSPEIKKELEENAISWRQGKFLHMPAVVIRGTKAINEANLSDDLLLLEEALKNDFPEIYEALVMGGDRELIAEKYSYRKDLLTGAKIFDPDIFFYEDLNRFWFTKIATGCDYADGGSSGDDAAMIMCGFEFDSNGIITGIFVLEELSISTKKFKNMVQKVNFISDTFADWAKKYAIDTIQEKYERQPIFRIGHDSRTVRDYIKDNLSRKPDFENLENLGIFTPVGKRGWSIKERHYVLKCLLSEGKVYFSKNLTVTQKFGEHEIAIKPHGYLYDAFLKCIDDPKKNIRDEKIVDNKFVLDYINAFEHAISTVRNRLLTIGNAI
jgi:hypothetical protein